MTSPTSLDHVDVWVFDLDNTLYPAHCRLFDQIDRRMGAFIADLLGCDPAEARRVQKGYLHSHGTTMRGLMTEHGVAPGDFLAYVHDIDYTPIPRNERLDRALAALPGRKLVFTNASTAHAARALDRLGVAHHFEATFDIEAAGWVPKPDSQPYARMIADHGIDPAASILFEDIPRNLEPARRLGMTTVWVRSDTEYGRLGAEGDHIDFTTDRVEDWLETVVHARGGAARR